MSAVWLVLCIAACVLAHPFGPSFIPPPAGGFGNLGTTTVDNVRSEYRALDGSGNNLANPTWGTVRSPLVRVQTPARFYSGPIDPSDPASPLADPMDGLDPTMPNPRLVSHKLFTAGGKETPNSILLNQLHVLWGHFVLSDIIDSQHSPLVRVPGMWFPLPWPEEDWWNDVGAQGDENPGDGTNPIECNSHPQYNFCQKNNPYIYLYRFWSFPGTGPGTSTPKTGYSSTTHWLDLSNVYGDPSEPQQFYGLWTMQPWFDLDDNGKMMNWGKFNFGPAGYDPGPLILGGAGPAEWIAGGDFRINKTPGIRTFILTFMKEHNRLVDEFRDLHPDWANETLFHEARRMNIAFYQAITLREYLAAAVGKPAVPYEGYNPDVTSNIDHTFTNVAFRYGHSALPSGFPMLDNNLDSCPYGQMTWQDVYYPSLWSTPDEEFPWNDPVTGEKTPLRRKYDYESMIRGWSNSLVAKVDLNFVDELRNQLIQLGGPRHGSDLIMLDVFRPRDMGIPLYNDAREFLGLGRVSSFEEITTSKIYQGVMEDLYGTVDRVDVYVGALAEDHETTEMGPFMSVSIREQFTRSRDGDRFFYENPDMFTPEEIELVHSTKLKDILLRNWPQIDPNALPVSSFYLNERQLTAFKPNAGFPAPAPHPKGYPWANRNLTDTYKLYWAIDRDVDPQEFTVQIMVQTEGWAGIGFGPEARGTMKGADIVLCRIWNGVPECRDSKAFDVGEPILDTNAGGTSDIWDVSVNRTDGILHAMFTRYLDNSNDPDHDNAITDDLRIIFAFNPITNDLIYHGPTRNPDTIINFEAEYIGPLRKVPISDGVRIVLYILCAIGVTLALFYSAIVVAKKDYFNFQTPEFCHLVNFGAILGYISVLLILPESQNNGTCKAHLWLFGMSFWIVFVGFFTKVARVYYIVKRTEQTLEVTVLPFYYLFVPLAVFMLAEMVMNICWDTLVPPDLTVEIDEDANTYTEYCAGNKWFWLGSVIWRACFLGLGVILAVQTKHLPQELNWSKEIAAAIYTMAVILAIGIPIGFFVGDSSTLVTILKGLTICVAYITVTTIVHSDSLARIFGGKDPREQTKSKHGVSRTGGHSSAAGSTA